MLRDSKAGWHRALTINAIRSDSAVAMVAIRPERSFAQLPLNLFKGYYSFIILLAQEGLDHRKPEAVVLDTVKKQDHPDNGEASSLFPDVQVVDAVLTLATRAPSIDNTQPWRWRVDRTSLHLYSDEGMRLPNTDPGGRDLILSCGAVLHHCVVALAAMGWRADVHRLPDPSDLSHLAAIEVSPHAPDRTDVTLAAAIPQRRTDRRTYSARPVAASEIASMAAVAARMGVTLRVVDAREKLHEIVKRAALAHATNRDYLVELARWSGRYGSRAGVPARNIPEHDCDAPIPGRIFAGPGLAQPPGASPADDNAVVLVLGSEADDRLAQLQVGEATSALLLIATAMGRATCPITEPLEIPETRDAVRDHVWGAQGYPQMLLRVGWAPDNAAPLPPTPRRPLSDVVRWSSL